MKHLNNWKSFNEGNSEKNQILTEIVDKLKDEGSLSDLYFGDILTPSVYFIFNNHPFTVSLTDRLGINGDYTTISVIVEVDGITESLGYYKINEVDKIVDLILNY